jgi:ribose 1,5-bisphosphokinase
VNWLPWIINAAGEGPERIGPGRLVLVVGPSGAGKDTLISMAREHCASDPRIVFPRRLVTRPASSHEDHDSISEQAFTQAASEGAFAFWWSAHGLRYALPLGVENDIRQDRTVVCNVSRTILPSLRDRYASVTVVLVTAPPDILAARLRARGRGSDGAVDTRLDRSKLFGDTVAAEFVVHNAGAPEPAARRLLSAIRTPSIAVTL